MELAYKQLKPIAQYMLLVRMSMGDKNVLLSDWYEASKKFILGSKEELFSSLLESNKDYNK